MINLPTVTLIALTGSQYMTDEHIKALRESLKEIKFGAVKLVQLDEVKTIYDWNYAICYDLWKYVDTGHCLLLHEDNEIIHPELWDNEWLKLDYIGSPWPLPRWKGEFEDEKGQIQRVGNSVSLRSRKLLKLPTDLKLKWKPFWGNFNEDGKFCVEWRTSLEENGCKFASFEQALKFGKEHELVENKDLKTFLTHKI